VGRGVPSRESTELKWEDHDRVGARFALRGLPAGEYDLVVENPDGQTAILGAAVRVDGSKNAPLPTRLALEQNFPNPFNPRTTIRFELPLPSPVRLSIFDARGRQVRTLVDEVLPPGSYDEFWNGEDDARRAVASGVYFYELRAGTARELRKMLLLR
ncbi:MAG TPA: T9SS type A sorting domain-containing protein, partial [Candidatus Krumholzibacteria bacterium]